MPDETKREKYIKNQWVGSIDVYSKMMQWLYINDYKTINTEEFYRWYKGDIEYQNRINKETPIYNKSKD